MRQSTQPWPSNLSHERGRAEHSGDTRQPRGLRCMRTLAIEKWFSAWVLATPEPPKLFARPCELKCSYIYVLPRILNWRGLPSRNDREQPHSGIRTPTVRP